MSKIEKIRCDLVIDDNAGKTNTDWFVTNADANGTVYPSREGIAFTPLINGKVAFKALEDAIRKATKSIDIITWGLDPAMKLGGYNSSTRLGDLLLEIEKEKKIEIRILVWEFGATWKLVATRDASPEKSIKRVEYQNVLQGYADAKENSRNIISKSIADERYIVHKKLASIFGNADNKLSRDESVQRRRDFKSFETNYYAYSYNGALFLNGTSIDHKKAGQTVGRVSDSAGITKSVQDIFYTAGEQIVPTLQIDYGATWEARGGSLIEISQAATSKPYYIQETIPEDYETIVKFLTHEDRKIREKDNNVVTFMGKTFEVSNKLDISNYLSVRSRDMSMSSAYESINNNRNFPDFPEYFSGAKSVLLATGATHHQKMVLIDYEDPKIATGFVMGHNLHKDYYDDDEHSFFAEGVRWPGFRPWQDISSQVYGPVLYDLNDNFCKAWDKVSNQESLLAKRAKVQLDSFVVSKGETCAAYSVSSAQICRTEPEYGEQTIMALYKKATEKSKNFIYIENQYFRYPQLAEHLIDIAEGRKSGRAKKPLFLFVVTNVPNTAGETAYTADMLDRLGYGDSLPQAQRDITGEYLNYRSGNIYPKWIDSTQQYLPNAVKEQLDASKSWMLKEGQTLHHYWTSSINLSDLGATALTMGTDLSANFVSSLDEIGYKILRVPRAFDDAVNSIKGAASKTGDIIGDAASNAAKSEWSAKSSEVNPWSNSGVGFLDSMITSGANLLDIGWGTTKNTVTGSIKGIDDHFGITKGVEDAIQGSIASTDKGLDYIESQLANLKKAEANYNWLKANQDKLQQELKNGMLIDYDKMYPNQVKELEDRIQRDGLEQVKAEEEAKSKAGSASVEDTEDREKAMEIKDIGSLKVAIGTLKSCYEAIPGKYYYTNVYIHSKFLTIDDAFLTLGSANINTRSFKADSELNIAVPHGQASKDMREHLWDIHMGEDGFKKSLTTDSTGEDNIERWISFMDQNWKQVHNKDMLNMHLVHLHEPDLPAGYPTD